MPGLATFRPPRTPDFPLEDDREPRVLVSQFGDGYASRIPDGLNSDPEKISLEWTNLTAAEAKYIFDFFAARKGADAFVYTVPWGDISETDWATPKIYRAPTYRRKRNASGSGYFVTATLEQVFDPVGS